MKKSTKSSKKDKSTVVESKDETEKVQNKETMRKKRKTKAEKVADTIAREYVEKHILELDMEGLKRAYAKNCSVPNPPKTDKIKAIKKKLESLTDEDLTQIYTICVKAGDSEDSMRSTLKAVFKKADALEICNFIAENPISKKEKATNENTTSEAKEETAEEPADITDDGSAEEI